MKTFSASNLAVDGSIVRLILDGELISADLKDWPELWNRLERADFSRAILLNDILGFPDLDFHIEVEDLLILAQIGEPFQPDKYNAISNPIFQEPEQISTPVSRDFPSQEGFSYQREETKMIEGIPVAIVTVIRDDKGNVPYLLNQLVLSDFVYDEKPCQVWLDNFCYYSNVHKWQKDKNNGNS